MTTNFELLPNELLIECFEYLNGLDIINAFDGLNSRFQILIESISLHINLEMISKTTFDRFCNQLLLNPLLKRQIYSLKLSNSSETCGQIQLFLLLFSLNDFFQLQSLTMTGVRFTNFEINQSTLSLSKNLHYLSLNYGSLTECVILISALSSLTIQRLSIPNLHYIPPIDKIRLITHLTVYQNCTLNELFKFIRYTPMLKYLREHP